MLAPKRVKHRKVQRGSMKGKAKGGTRLNHGEYGIQALEAHWITNRQIEAARIAMTRETKRGYATQPVIAWLDDPVDAFFLEIQGSGRVQLRDGSLIRVGSGKGNPEGWVAVVKPGRIMFEIGGVEDEVAREALRLAINKLPIKCKIVTKETEAAE